MSKFGKFVLPLDVFVLVFDRTGPERRVLVAGLDDRLHDDWFVTLDVKLNVTDGGNVVPGKKGRGLLSRTCSGRQLLTLFLFLSMLFVAVGHGREAAVPENSGRRIAR